MPNQFSQPHNVDTKFTVCSRENRNREKEQARKLCTATAAAMENTGNTSVTRPSIGGKIKTEQKRGKHRQTHEQNKQSQTKQTNQRTLNHAANQTKKGKISKQEVNGKGALVREGDMMMNEQSKWMNGWPAQSECVLVM